MLNSILDQLTQLLICAGLFLVVLIVVAVMLSDGIKTWVKTCVFLVASGIALAFLGWIVWQVFATGNVIVAAICGIVILALAVFVLWQAVVHHKTGWKRMG